MTSLLTSAPYADIVAELTVARPLAITQAAQIRGLDYGPYGYAHFDGFTVTLRVSCRLDSELRREDALLDAGAKIGHTLGAAAVICNTHNRVLRTDVTRPLAIADIDV